MYTSVKYVMMFLAVVLLQLFFVDTLNLGMFVNPLLYVSFIILLPMNMSPVAVLFSGLGMGIVMDVATGMGGCMHRSNPSDGLHAHFSVEHNHG